MLLMKAAPSIAPIALVTVIGLTATAPAEAFFWRKANQTEQQAQWLQASGTAAPREDAAASAPDTTTTEMQRHIAAGAMTEMRTTYNGRYGASLLFHADSLTFYVTLFNGKSFWRVVKTDQHNNAEALYASFADQTRDLAHVYLDTVRLEAEKRHADRMVAMNQLRLRRLEQEIAQQQEQAALVSRTVAESRQQATSLSGDLRSTAAQLEALQRQIRELEAQRQDTGLSLPEAQPQNW